MYRLHVILFYISWYTYTVIITVHKISNIHFLSVHNSWHQILF